MGTHPLMPLLALLVAVPAFGLLMLTRRRRLPHAALPAALAVVLAEGAGVVGTVDAGSALAVVIAAAGLFAAAAAVGHSLATGATQRSPWWWHGFDADLAGLEAEPQPTEEGPRT